ncbi:outer membrane protein [Bradyrhizobium sp. PMVTL-01]|uniref:outer membrane protein n=1 Tax=Bradyrhizobium sp. PMVTL-01 TaxID=3434999 RepID=UPI003F7234EB
MRSGVLLLGATTIALVASGAGNAADFEPEVKLPPAVWNWSGGYIGGHVGGGYGQTSFSNPYGPSIFGGIVDTPTFLAGGQIGYNWKKNGWVFGVELDASGAVSDGTNTCLASSGFVVGANCKAGPNVFATATGRVGYTFGASGGTLAYLKGGVAWQNNRGDVVNNYEWGLSPQEKTHFGYGRIGGIIGLGVEQALTPAWSVTAEYDYLNFGGPSVATPPTGDAAGIVAPLIRHGTLDHRPSRPKSNAFAWDLIHLHSVACWRICHANDRVGDFGDRTT